MSNLRLWSRYSEYDNTIDEDTVRRLMEDNFVSHSVAAPCTQLDVVKQGAQQTPTPVAIESVSNLLARDTFIRGRLVFDPLGNALDKVALNYPNVCAQTNALAWCNGLRLATTEDLIEICLAHDIL